MSLPATSTRAIIYARISEDRDETHLGVQRQLDDCRTLTLSRGWDITEEYVDNDVSAWKGGKRPSYQRMLDDIRAGASTPSSSTTRTVCIAIRASSRSSSTSATAPA